MELATRSPRRRTLTPEEKKQRDEQYQVDIKGFSEILKQLVQIFNSLVLLNSALSLGQAGKGAYLAFPNPNPGQEGTFIPFNRKHLRSANAKFAKTLLALKNYLRVSRRKARPAAKPSDFTGTYIPVYASQALLEFFTAAPGNFGPLHPIQATQTGQPGAALMDSLQMVRQGYLLRNTATMLFFIYAHANQLQAEDNAQYSKADQVMMTAFGGQIPAAFYSYMGADGKVVKVPMNQAVSQGLITAPVNTFQAITQLYPPGTRNKKGEDVGFRTDRFNTYYYQNIAAANYYSRTVLAAFPEFAEVAVALRQNDVLQSMLDEHTLVKAVSDEWHQLLEPGRRAQRDARKKRQDAIKKQLKAQQQQGLLR